MNVNNCKMKCEEVSLLNEGRCAMGAAVFKSCLVVAGGEYNKSNSSPRDEIYILALNKWRRIPKLN